jgi:DNA ligase D-like protein (predicted ligase)/DNA ligase D-like protein (predicted polymerase)/DNA ligase D-like protein (predicted 3'-phosphoesterase)
MRRRRVEFPEQLPAHRSGDAWRMDAGGRELRLSNLDKLYWPDDGFTKGDLLAYYYNAAPLLLPHLRDRPLTMLRMPDGIAGESFYEKRVPSHAPGWLPTASVPGEERKPIDMIMAQDLASLLYVINLGCIELHPLHSRAASLDFPEFALFDLDPFEPYTFADVRTAARLVKVALDGLGLRGYAKTSGATGMQVEVPLEPVHPYADVRAFVEAVGRLMVRAYREKVTMAWPVAERAGKVFVDHQMNRRGANIASAYSLRPRPGAPVSMPLDWDEVDSDVEPGDFRIDNIWERLAGGDRFAPMLTDRQRLDAAMDALGIRPEGGPSRRPAAPGPGPAVAAIPAPTPDGEQAPDLDEYRRKRDFSRTPEPSGGSRAAASLPEAPHAAGVPEPAELEPGPVFCIQQHHARRLHHDVRFERDGALVSFAVPKRLPEEPGVPHLAVNTEDHPMEYLTFTGSIPEGGYGAGEVRLFDLGTYEPVEVEDGKWTVRLHGSRYHGTEYHLVRTKRDWLCFLSRRTPLTPPARPPVYEPMMAQPAAEPFDDDHWLFEVKWDGHRCLAALDADRTRLTSRTSRDVTGQFPEMDGLHRQLASRNAVVDGEIVAFDEEGRPSFQRMQDRFHRSAEELARHRGRVPIQFLAFDLLWLDGEPLLEVPLQERRARLAEVLVERADVRLSQAVTGRGEAFFAQIKALGLEGIVAKRLASPYRPGARSHDWRKIKAVRRQDCVIVGWTRGKGERSQTLGSLLLAVRADGGLRYAGNVGTGFTQAFLERLLPELEAREVSEPPVQVPPDPRLRGTRWLRPDMVCEVEYVAWTDDGRLRAASFKGIRTDKLPEDARREDVR